MSDERFSEDTEGQIGASPLTSRFSSSLSRRRVLQMSVGGLALTAMSSLLAACGDDDDDDDDGGGGATDPTATTGEDSSGDEEATEPAEDGGEATEAPDEGGATEEGGVADEGTAADSPGEESASDLTCEDGGTLVYALSTDPPNMDPHVDTGTGANNVKYQIYNGLTRFWEGGEVEPDLAASWEVSDDGLSYTFSLVEGVTWHSGDPFTSADVQVSIERIKDPGVGASSSTEISVIDSVDTPDDLTAVFNLSAPSAPLITYLADPTAFILSKVFLDGGGDPDTESIGTGPFSLESREPGVRIVVVKNPEYFQDGPFLDQIDFIPYADENTRMAAAFGGEIDLAEYVPWKDFQGIRDDDGLTLHAGDAAAFMTMMYHTEKPPFDDPAVRYALGFAYDRDSMIEIVFFGEGSPITGGLVPPGLWGHADDLDGTFTYDPDKAKQMLADAGYPDGFECTLLSTSQYGMHQGTAEIAQQNLRDIGITCELELFDWPTVVEKYATGDFHFRVHGLGTGTSDPDTTLAQYFETGSPGASSIAFSNEEVDSLLAEARATIEQDARKALYDEVQKLIIDLAPFSFLTYRVQAEVSRATIQGYEHFPGGLGFASAKTLEKTRVNCE